MARGIGSPALKVTAMTTAESATVEPTEMSMLPRMMTKVMGSTRKAMSRNDIGGADERVQR